MNKWNDTECRSGCAWENGRFVPADAASISLMDVGFCRSDATYDVVAVWNGSFFRLDKHLERFQRGCEKKGFTSGPGIEEIRSILFECVRRSELSNAYVEMVMTRGLVPEGTRDPRLFRNNFFAYAIPYVSLFPEIKLQTGVDLIVSRRARRIPATSVDPTVKNFHWADLTTGLTEAYESGADSAVLLDENGALTEGPGFNVFGVSSGAVVTPKQGVLQGVTRRTVLELAVELGIQHVEGYVPESDIRDFQEMFLTSTAGGIIPVRRIGDSMLVSTLEGSLTQTLKDAYWKAHDRPDWNTAIEYGSD